MGTINLAALRFGDGVKSDYVRTEYSSSDVISSLTLFAEEHFRGILSLEVIKNDSGVVTVCADGLAYFLKLLLYRVFGRAEIKATVRCQRHEMNVTFDLCGVLIDTDGLFEIAERSGFSIEAEGDFTLRLTLPVKRTNALRVYAGDTNALLRTLYAVFFMKSE